MSIRDQTPIAPLPDVSVPSLQSVRPRRRGRLLRWTVVVLATLLLAFYAGGGWFFSSQIRADALEPEAPGEYSYETEVLAVSDGSVTLSLESDNEHLTGLGIRGVAWSDGYGTVGRIVAVDEDSVTRQFTPVSGTPTVGTMVDLDGFAYLGDPQTGLGLAFETVTYPGPLGSMEAWHVPGGGDEWVILVHGKAAPLRESLRLLPALHDSGMDALVINYRNDVGMPGDPSGLYRYGLTEWEDVEAAVRYAQSQGAGNVALVGYSMGGALVTSFLRESPVAVEVDAVVLDAPMLDFGATVDRQAADESLPFVGLPVPQSLVDVAKLISDWRFDVDWGRLDYVGDGAEYETPMLIFHGSADEKVPIETSRQLAELRPDLVDLVEQEGAGHVLSWNVDPEAYEQHLAEFLTTSFE